VKKRLFAAIGILLVISLFALPFIHANEWWQCWGVSCGIRCSCRQPWNEDPQGCWALCYMGGVWTWCNPDDCGPPMR
jgi:hypothetical protein